RDLFLKRAEHLRATTRDPPRPRLSNRRRQHELVPELDELVSVDVKAHVVFCSLAQDLLVHASPVGRVVEVVRDRRTAPTNVEWKLDSTACLWCRVEVVGNRYRPRRGSELRSSCVRHVESV